MAAKRLDPAKQKEKRQKIIAIVGAVLLLAVLAFQLPRVMKMMHKKGIAAACNSACPGASASSAPPTGTTPSLAAPTLAGSGLTTTTPAVASADGVTSGDSAPAVQPGQLASFSLFKSKDPFAQQLYNGSSVSTGSGSGASSGSSGGSSPSSGGGSAPSVPSGSQPAPGSAVISVNGTLVSVTVGGDFPSDQPMFHLVSLSAHSAQISIVGGSYASGAPTVTLRENKPLTLMNTADGTRYKLVLKPQGTSVPAAPTTPTPTSTTTPTTTTTPSH
jgi:hypothetical protein